MRRSLLMVLAVAAGSAFVLTSALAGSSFTDAAADATGNAPDITAVQVSNDDGGQILFDVAVSNLTPESALFVPIDVDRNATTGDEGGAEYVLWWFASANADESGWDIERWDGTTWVQAAPTTMRGSPTATGVQFSINASDLGGASGFAFSVKTLRFVADHTVGVDRAPEGLATWAYDLTKPPPPTPPARTIVKPVFGKVLTIPAKPVAGKRFTFGIQVTRSDTGLPLTKGTMVCDPSIMGKVLPHVEQFKQGLAAMSFLVPKTAKGKQLRVNVKIVSGNQSRTKVVTYKVG